MDCSRCQRPLRECPVCNGGRASARIGMFTCVACANTGLVCDEHGGEHGR